MKKCKVGLDIVYLSLCRHRPQKSRRTRKVEGRQQDNGKGPNEILPLKKGLLIFKHKVIYLDIRRHLGTVHFSYCQNQPKKSRRTYENVKARSYDDGINSTYNKPFS